MTNNQATLTIVLANSNDSSNEPVVKTTKNQTKSTRRRMVDPNAPKRACSAFVLFSRAERANVKRDYPEANGVELFKRLGEKWQAADAETKAQYAALYAANKAKADDAIRAYVQVSASTRVE